MNRAYFGWLAGASLSAFGDTAVFFALGWAAAGLGPHVAGLVLTGFTVPRGILLLTCYLLLAALASTAYPAALFAAVQGIGVGIFTSHWPRCSLRGRHGLT